VRELELRPDASWNLRIGGRLLHWPQHQGEWSTKLVGNIREEGGLGAVDFSERFGSTPFNCESLHIRQTRCELNGNQAQEGSIVLIQYLHRAHRGYQYDAWSLLSWQHYRKYQSGARRDFPGSGGQGGEETRWVVHNLSVSGHYDRVQGPGIRFA